MRILVLCKRQYTGKDLIDDEYGRLFEIPEALVAQGHQVKGLTISYRKKNTGLLKPRLVEWLSFNCTPFSLFGALKHIKHIRKEIDEFEPDIVWSSSDAWHIIAANFACKNKRTFFVADLYDNYESFGISRIPFLISVLKRACKNASGVTSVTSTLRTYLINNYGLNKNSIEVIGNAVNPDIFFPREKRLSQQELGLPSDGKFMGTAGALTSNRGIKVLFESFLILAKKIPNLYLVIAGPRDKTINQYRHPRIIDLGNLPSHKIPSLFSSLDASIICNLDSDFGRYCSPQKYQEMIACETSVISANVGEMSLIMINEPETLFNPMDPFDLAQKVEKLLFLQPLSNKPKAITWAEQTKRLLLFFQKVINH